jgi:prolyl oligopeptidase
VFILSQQNLLWIADLEPEKLGLDIQWKKVFNEWGAEFDV